MKICIKGVPGIGKSTVAALLAKELNLPHHTELFKDNPYMADGEPWQITQYQLHTSFQQYLLNSVGVFEVSPQVSVNIFLKPEHRKLVKPRTEIYDYEFYLDAPYKVIRDRILARNRKGLLEIELKELPKRLARYRSYIDNNVNTKYIINACGSPSEIVTEIINRL